MVYTWHTKFEIRNLWKNNWLNIILSIVQKLHLHQTQMMPYWASSCSSRWLYASHGQIMVISEKTKKQIMIFLKWIVVWLVGIFSWCGVLTSAYQCQALPFLGSPLQSWERKKALLQGNANFQADTQTIYTKKAYPITPLLGGLLLNWRLLLCLNWGGPDSGPVALRGALLPILASGLARSKFILVVWTVMAQS